MNPLGAAITITCCLLVIALSQVGAVVTIIAAVCYITQGQDLAIGFHFTAIRLVVLAAFLRVLTRSELKIISFNALDRALLYYSAAILVIPILRMPSSDTFVRQLGVFYNVLFPYFAFRGLLTDFRQFSNVLLVAVWVIVPFAFFLIYEADTGRNIFSAFGGVEAMSMVRDGHIRAEGPFRSPITAGAFGATFSIFYLTLFLNGVKRSRSGIGLVASLIVVVAARSSGPFLGMLLGVIAILTWRFRTHTRRIRWAIVIALFGLNAIMKAPVWFLLGRISDVVGGGGYHRAELIDRFVNTTSSWWLIGTSDTADWMATQLSFGGADLTNQFVSDGVNAGLLGLISSILVVVRSFQQIGRALKTPKLDIKTEKLLWGVGSTLVCTVGILFSVTYFDQMDIIWSLLLACVAGATALTPSNIGDILDRSVNAPLAESSSL